MAATTTTRREVPESGSSCFAERVNGKPPYEWGYGSTPRTAKLRDGLNWKALIVEGWIDVFAGQGKCTFREGLRVDMHRPRLLTKSYKETEGQPWAIRKAKAVRRVLEEMPIFIKPGELIVGDANGAPDKVRWYPETSVHWIPDSVTTGGFSEMVTAEERKEIVEDICEYWKDKCVSARIRAALPEDLRPYLESTTVTYCAWDSAYIVPPYDFEALYREGLKARVDRVEDKLKELESQAWRMNPTEYLEKKTNWQAMAMCGKAILHFAQRYAELARKQGAAEKDKARKRELEEIAAILDWVPANRPRTFHEALQFFWMIEVAAHFLAVEGMASGIRIDQIWWPYYEADIRAGRITREEAMELVECLFLKIQETGFHLDHPTNFAAHAGGELFYATNICGTTPDGRDASNDLSSIIMEAMANLHINSPAVALRYHLNISPDVVDRAIDLLGTVGVHPSFWNDGLLEQFALRRGWSPQDAKKATTIGCVDCHIMGTVGYGVVTHHVGGCVLPKILEEVLFQREMPGPLSWLVSPTVRDPRKVQSADELLDLFVKRVLFYGRVGAVVWNISQQIAMDYAPDPCNSFLLDFALDSGVDLAKHKEQDSYPLMEKWGMQNVSDSLAAIQKLIFDENKYTMEQMLSALAANWQGYEEMRQDFLNAPKYGNDDDYADDWARTVAVVLNDAIGQINDAWGHRFTWNGSVAIVNVLVGFGTGATPDGRGAGTPVADGTRSPMAGADKNGPTAVLNSAGKIPFMHTELMNQKFLPQFLEGQNKKLFAEYLKEWHEKGTIPHIQFNVIDNKVLREAQKHPEKYTNLQVRVAGYSAFFVDLPRESQDNIIARTEQSLC